MTATFLETVCFLAICALWIGFFVSEGMVAGSGLVAGVFGADRGTLANRLGPRWHGSELWLALAGAATFVAFPRWYDPLYEAFAVALFVLVAALIVRNVGLDRAAPGWQWALVACGAVVAALPGFVWANLARGLELDADGDFAGTLSGLLSAYAFAGALTSLIVFATCGAHFLAARGEAPATHDPAALAARRLAPVAVVVIAGFGAWTVFGQERILASSAVAACAAVLAAAIAVAYSWAASDRAALAWTAVAVAALFCTLQASLYPDALGSGLSLGAAAAAPWVLLVTAIVGSLAILAVLVYQTSVHRRLWADPVEPPAPAFAETLPVDRAPGAPILLNDRYELIRELGHGGMAAVSLARDSRVGNRLVAVKEMMDTGPDSATRFKRELRIMAELNHRNVVTVHDHFESDGGLYIVMEYVRRGALVEIDYQALSPEVVLHTLDGVLAALEALDQVHAVHRDIKPSNVLVTIDGDVKVADFGIATIAAATVITTPGMAPRTELYTAPEVWKGEPSIDIRADLYAVGLMGFELLTARHPFADRPALALLDAHCADGVPPLPDPLDSRLDDWLRLLVAIDRDDRFGRPALARKELEATAVDVFGRGWRDAAAIPAEPRRVRPDTPGGHGAAEGERQRRHRRKRRRPREPEHGSGAPQPLADESVGEPDET